MGSKNSQRKNQGDVKRVDENVYIVNSITCFYTNADQFRNKMNEFQVRIRDIKPKIIGISEVKAKNSSRAIQPQEFKLDWIKNYNMFYLNLDNNEGRGLLMYIHEEINAEEVKLETNFEENLFVKIKTSKNESILVGLIYRSPSENSNEKNEQLRKLINEAVNMDNAHLLLMGDFNYPNIDWDLLLVKGEQSEEQKFMDCLQDNFLFQHVNRPTRWRGTNEPSVLDLIITADDRAIEEIEYQSPLGKSDHCILIFNYVCSLPMRKVNKTRKNYRKANYQGLKADLDEKDWDTILNNKDINKVWGNFKKIIKELEEKHVPISKLSNKNTKIPLDKEIINLIKEKSRLSKKFVHTKDPETRKQYNRTRNKVTKLVRQARKKFEENLAQEAKTNPKKIWQYINSKSKVKQGIGDLCTDPTNQKSPQTDDDTEKANILGNYFSSVFTKEPDNEIPTLEKRKTLHKWEKMQSSESKVIKALEALKPDKSPGIDGMHPRFLRELRYELVKPLNMIFNKSITEKKVPNEWKEARISAIYKKGKKSMASNYRPVSLTSVICKLMERLVRDHIIEHFQKNKFFTEKQYGFITGRSTSIQLIRVLEEWTEAVDKGQGVDCVYMDFQKAFDTVPHKRLLSKLEAYNLGEEMISWIRDYLSGRKQQVSINGANSKWHEVTSGIPQGSVIGPILFVIYINDLPDIVNSTVYLFADDTKIFKIINNQNDRDTLQNDLKKLTEWSETWLLKFHPDKCKFMHIGKNGPPDDFHYDLMGTSLEQVHEEKDIGVTIDENLTFESHISNKVKKANSMFSIIRRSFQHLDEKTFLPLYKALVRTHLDYASSVWFPYKEKYIDLIEGVQRRATKQIPGLGKLSYEERLRKLKLPTLKYRRYRGDMIELYKMASEKYDPAITDFLKWRKYFNERTTGRGNQQKLYAQRPRLDLRKYSFTVRATNIWNSLPDSVASASNINTFKNRLDKFWSSQEVLHNYKSTINRTGSQVSREERWDSDEEDLQGTCVGRNH